ncbi:MULTISPECIES: hypothetical protein [unclassified Streptomyces]|uniref:hypothetical protein n=1 Tax=unclassified Streptomyces TaxID=2593676 RepID=UPI000DC4FBBC|nr:MULTISPECIES: hypothetical protein [unclassified Streptomyces]RAJ88853.1 hypothetical protein K377_02315 [Streptomyces sp. PsTaAH-137]
MSTVAEYREQRRMDAAAAEERRAMRERSGDERAARLREQARADQERDREVRLHRRQERAARRAASLTPGQVYRRGTLALVVASGLASLPAQVLHFVGISPMLLPLPLALEGTAWVVAAGVAYADSRHLAARVRWLLRALVVASAGFAASINYTYGTHLPNLSGTDATTAGWGLAAVTLFGPLLFEIRQWVCTLAAVADDDDRRERGRHTRTRRWHHRRVARIADRLLSAAPFGSLTTEQAWARAWQIHTGATAPGMTPDLYRKATRSAAALAQAQRPVDDPKNAEESTETKRNRSMADLPVSIPAPITPNVTELPRPVAVGFLKSALPAKPVKSIESLPARPIELRPVPAESPRPRSVTGRVPEAAKSSRPKRTFDELLAEARTATAGWPDAKLTAEGIRRELRTSPANARKLRDTLRAERATAVTA